MKKVVTIILSILALAIAGVLLFINSDSKNPYQETVWGKFSGSCASNELPAADYGKSFSSCDYSVPTEEIPTFKEIDFPFNHVFDNTKSLPLMAAALIDIDNDGVDEIFVGGGVTQKDALFKYTSTGMVDISEQVGLPSKPDMTTTLGASSFDIDGDGYNDLLLTGDYGVTWYKNDGTTFSPIKINAPLNDKSNAATTTLGDFNNDGHIDIFLSAYIRLDKMEGQTIFTDYNYGGSSLLLQNNGDNTFTDVTTEVGLSYVHNTFQAVFVDIDNDGFLDLVVAHDTGEVRTYKNNGGSTFEMKTNPLTGKFAYPMGIAVGDYNNDGFMDFFFSNTGSSVPVFLARGDLAEEDVFTEKWILFKNNGDFTFDDVADEAKVADFEFSWGALFEDFNLDGLQDLVVAENYVDFPPHQLFKLPCRFLLQRANGQFAAVEDQANAINKNYAIAPLTSDFNHDGYPDLIYSNLNGPMRTLINDGGDSNYIAVRLKEIAKNAGARVVVTLQDDSILSDAYVIGEGLSSDQTSTLTFGLGTQESVQKVVIYYPGGETTVIDNPGINQVHSL